MPNETERCRFDLTLGTFHKAETLIGLLTVHHGARSCA